MNRVQSTLTRKAGPLPVWGWGVLVFAVTWFFFFRPPKAAGGVQLPFTPARGAGSAAQQPASGQGSAGENANAALLAALAQNSAAQDGLLAAVQQPQSAASSPDDTTFATAPTVTAPQSPAVSPSLTTTQPAGTYISTYTSPGGYDYSAFTSMPAALDPSGGYANGIVPAMNVYLGGRDTADTGFVVRSTPSYSSDPANVQNAVAQATKTGKPVAI